jgi:hypothetical protein
LPALSAKEISANAGRSIHVTIANSGHSDHPDATLDPVRSIQIPCAERRRGVLDEEQLDLRIANLTRLMLSIAAAAVAVFLVIWRILSEIERLGG